MSPKGTGADTSATASIFVTSDLRAQLLISVGSAKGYLVNKVLPLPNCLKVRSMFSLMISCSPIEPAGIESLSDSLSCSWIGCYYSAARAWCPPEWLESSAVMLNSCCCWWSSGNGLFLRIGFSTRSAVGCLRVFCVPSSESTRP